MGDRGKECGLVGERAREEWIIHWATLNLESQNRDTLNIERKGLM